jgi:hypothetical protein
MINRRFLSERGKRLFFISDVKTVPINIALIERVIDEEATLEEVEFLMEFFQHNDDYIDYFIGYKRLRDANPKKRESNINGDQASS